MKWKFKVPCDAFFDDTAIAQALDGKMSGDPIDEEIGVYLGGDDWFPQNELLIDKTISFDFQMTELVPLWCYTKDKDSAKAVVDYIAYLTGDHPSDLYHRIIYSIK